MPADKMDTSHLNKRFRAQLVDLLRAEIARGSPPESVVAALDGCADQIAVQNGIEEYVAEQRAKVRDGCKPVREHTELPERDGE